MSDKDKNAIHNLFYEYHYTDDLGVIKSKIAEYVATVRREEREEAFQRVLNLTRTTATSTGMPEIWALHEAIKRAAESGEGESDG